MKKSSGHSGKISRIRMMIEFILFWASKELCKYTKYSSGRNLHDLFYWPDGFCFNTVAVILFLSTGIVFCIDATVTMHRHRMMREEDPLYFKDIEEITEEDIEKLPEPTLWDKLIDRLIDKIFVEI